MKKYCKVKAHNIEIYITCEPTYEHSNSNKIKLIVLLIWQLDREEYYYC